MVTWNRKTDEPSSPRPAEPSPATRPATSTSLPHTTTQPAGAEPLRRGERATIGPSIFIKGDLTGDEDLVIEGRVEGKVDLKQNNVTIGRDGRVKADVYGQVVTVEGEVDGNVFAREQAVLRQAGAIRGNITAPRVVLEDGSRFKGSIDMEAKGAGKTGGAGPESQPQGPAKEHQTAAVQAAG